MSEPDFLVGEKDPWVRKIGYRLHRAITRAIQLPKRDSPHEKVAIRNRKRNCARPMT